jgi:hypothetical protein
MEFLGPYFLDRYFLDRDLLGVTLSLDCKPVACASQYSVRS